MTPATPSVVPCDESKFRAHAFIDNVVQPASKLMQIGSAGLPDDLARHHFCHAFTIN